MRAITTTEQLEEDIEIDESYFGSKGNRDRDAAGKIPVFRLLKRDNKVYAVMIQNAKQATIEDRVRPDSIVYTDSFRSHNALDVSDFKHYRINHSELFADGHNHINGIESFWDHAKHHLRKFNGIPKSHFHLYLNVSGGLTTVTQDIN